MGGSSVNGSGAGVGGDVVGVDAEDGALKEGVLEGGAVKPGAVEAREDAGLAEIAGGGDPGGQLSGDDVDRRVRVLAGGDGHVLKVGVEGHGEGRREGPGGGGPDDGVDLASMEGAGCLLAELGEGGGEAIADVDGGAGVLVVLDFRVGEGGAVVDAPVDGLEAAVDEALFEEAVEGFEGFGLVGA